MSETLVGFWKRENELYCRQVETGSQAGTEGGLELTNPATGESLGLSGAGQPSEIDAAVACGQSGVSRLARHACRRPNPVSLPAQSPTRYSYR